MFHVEAMEMNQLTFCLTPKISTPCGRTNCQAAPESGNQRGSATLLLAQWHCETYWHSPPAWLEITENNSQFELGEVEHIINNSIKAGSNNTIQWACEYVCPGGGSPAGWLCPIGITCHSAESLIDASCFLVGNYGAQMSSPNLWLCNVDTHIHTRASGRGDTASPQGFTHRFVQQMC